MFRLCRSFSVRQLPLLLVLLSCSDSGVSTDPEPGSSASAVIDDSDCNLSTPLQRGIPGSPGHLIASERNPNGDSELALLMRRFVDDWTEAKRLLMAGKPVARLYQGHRKMRCAWHTDPKERTGDYDGRAQGHLLAVQAFDAKPGRATYNAAIASCVACHTVSCPGPLDLIGRLRWDE